MPTHTVPCRACGAPLGANELLRIEGMPCGAQNFPIRETLGEDGSVDLVVVQCPCCGVVQLTNPPVPYWRDVIRAVGFSDEMQAFRLDQFKGFVERHALQGKNGMEFGCGDGAYLRLLTKSGLDAHGLEHEEALAKRCRESGLDVRTGFASDGKQMEGGPFDAFFVFSYLEHVPELQDFLATIRSNLRTDAVGLVEVPNFDMILKQRLFSEFIIDHLFYFTGETLRHTLENNGFRVLSCEPIWHDYILSAEVEVRPKLAIAPLVEEQTVAVERFKEVLQQYDKVAVWGAGHQAFTMLALVAEVNNIRYIADSAPFKQGRYSPVTHIPVCSSEALDSDPVDALLIMGGSYSEEIASIAWSKFGQENIYICNGNDLELFTPGTR